MLRQACGDVTDAAAVLERLAEAIRILDEDAPDDTATTSSTSGAER